MLIWAWQNYRDELLADFARFYGLFDVRTLPVRRLAGYAATMIKQPESWVYRAHDPDWQWGIQEYLLAIIADAENLSLWQRGNGKGQKPEPVPRPSNSKKYASRTVYTNGQLDTILKRNRIDMKVD